MDTWRDEVTKWWGGDQVRLAFIIAPLAFPALIFLWAALTSPWPGALLVAIWAAVNSLPLTYIGTLAVGVPMYRFLCARNLTTFWIAAAAGFVGGTVVSTIVFLLVVVTLRLPPSLFGEDVTVSTLLLNIVLIGGLPGATIGTSVWLIARPDRTAARSADSSS
jgi:hypothetical protein